MEKPAAVFIGAVTYGVDGDRRLLLDVLAPAGVTRPCPLVVFVHGGGWHEGDRGAGMHPWLNPLLVSHGFVTASVTYRLSGDAHWPVPLDDVRAALSWLHAHAGEFGADPARMGIWGHSAGAHLAAMAALTSPGSQLVRAVALSACPADLRGERLDSGNEVARLLGPDAGAATLAEASPVCHVRAGAPPFLLAHGTEDDIVPIDGASHEWADLPGRPETAGTFGAVALPFFREHLGG